MKSAFEYISKTSKNIFLKKTSEHSSQIKKIYRQDGITLEKEIEYNKYSGNIEKITKYNYFDDKKISSIEEYNDGKKFKETNFHFFMVVTDYDITSGKKVRSTNYDLKDKSKIISKYDYDAKTEKIIRISVYRPDGKTIAFIKELSPTTGNVSRCINYKKNSDAISSVSKYNIVGETCIRTTYYYQTPIYALTPDTIEKQILTDDINNKVLNNQISKNSARLIDKLYKNKDKSTIKIS